MNEKSLKQKQSEMRSIWDSFEWILKDKLISLDNNARAITSEMRTMGVPAEMAREFVAERFMKLCSDVVTEQCERFDKKEMA